MDEGRCYLSSTRAFFWFLKQSSEILESDVAQKAKVETQKTSRSKFRVPLRISCFLNFLPNHFHVGVVQIVFLHMNILNLVPYGLNACRKRWKKGTCSTKTKVGSWNGWSRSRRFCMFYAGLHEEAARRCWCLPKCSMEEGDWSGSSDARYTFEDLSQWISSQ